MGVAADDSGTELEVKRLNCCVDMAEQQAKSASLPEHKLGGTLSLSVCYLTQKAAIEVTVGRAFNLPGTGKKGVFGQGAVVVLEPLSCCLE